MRQQGANASAYVSNFKGEKGRCLACLPACPPANSTKSEIGRAYEVGVWMSQIIHQRRPCRILLIDGIIEETCRRVTGDMDTYLIALHCIALQIATFFFPSLKQWSGWTRVSGLFIYYFQGYQHPALRLRLFPAKTLERSRKPTEIPRVFQSYT